MIGNTLGPIMVTAALLMFGASTASASTGPDTTPPSIPANVVYTPELDTGAIHWDLSTDDATPRFEMRYRIYYDGDLAGTLYAAAANNGGFDFSQPDTPARSPSSPASYSYLALGSTNRP